MMDEEILSRYLDGDLPETEARALEQRLESDPELQLAMDEMTRVSQAVGELAERMQPPPELDALMEPLRRSPPSSGGLRKPFVWMAAAATLIIGITVTFHVQRPQQPEEHQPALKSAMKNPKKDGYYQLYSFPTPLPGEERLGATEHLLAEAPLALPDPEDPPPLVVLGPLTEEEAREGWVVLDGPDDGAASEAEGRAGRQDFQLPPARPGWDAESEVADSRQGILIMSIEGRELKKRLGLRYDMVAGHYQLRLVIENSIVTECEAREEQNRDLVAAVCLGLVGLQISDVVQAETDAELVIAAR